MKVSSEGSLVWSRAWPNSAFSISDLILTSDQKLIIAGTVNEIIDIDPSENEQWYTNVGSTDLFVLSFDLDGGMLSSMMSPASAWQSSITIDSDKNDNFYLTCTSSSSIVFDEQIGPLTGNPDTNVVRYMAKYSSDMELIWVNVIDVVDGMLKFYGFESDSNGNTYWSGSVIGDVMFNYSSGELNFSQPIAVMDANGNPNTAAFLMKLDGDGNVIWIDTLGEENYTNSAIKSVALMDESSLIILGVDVFFMELSDGTVVNTQGINITRVDTESGDFVQDYPNEGNVKDITVSNGKIWKCNYGSGVSGLDIFDSSLVFSTSDQGDTFISSYDLNFNLINVFQIGGSGQQLGLCLIPSLTSEVWVAGDFWWAEEPSGFSGVSIDNLGYSNGSFMVNFNYCQVPVLFGEVSGDSSICVNTNNLFLVEVDEPINSDDFRWTITAAQDSQFLMEESLNSLELTPSYTDTLYISCRLLNSCGISNYVGPIQTVVRELPSINVISNLPSLVCENSEVVISIEQEEGVTYVPDVSIELDVPFPVTANTNFAISALSNFGCYADTLLGIMVHPSPVSDWNVSPSEIVCVGELVTSVYTEESNLLYSSNFINEESFTISEDVVLELIIEDELGCVGYYYEQLHLSPLPDIEMHPQDIQIIEGEPFFFQIESSESDLEYNWQMETMNVWNPLYNSNLYQGVNTSILEGAYSYGWMDGYKYRCQITQGTCTSYSDFAELHVQALNSVESSISIQDFDVWPNPATDNLTIALPITLIGSTLSIYNSIGERIDLIIIQSEQFNYNIQKHPSGIYHIKIDKFPEATKTFYKY